MQDYIRLNCHNWQFTPSETRELHNQFPQHTFMQWEALTLRNDPKLVEELRRRTRVQYWDGAVYSFYEWLATLSVCLARNDRDVDQSTFVPGDFDYAVKMAIYNRANGMRQDKQRAAAAAALALQYIIPASSLQRLTDWITAVRHMLDLLNAGLIDTDANLVKIADVLGVAAAMRLRVYAKYQEAQVRIPLVEAAKVEMSSTRYDAKSYEKKAASVYEELGKTKPAATPGQERAMKDIPRWVRAIDMAIKARAKQEDIAKGHLVSGNLHLMTFDGIQADGDRSNMRAQAYRGRLVDVIHQIVMAMNNMQTVFNRAEYSFTPAIFATHQSELENAHNQVRDVLLPEGIARSGDVDDETTATVGTPGTVPGLAEKLGDVESDVEHASKEVVDAQQNALMARDSANGLLIKIKKAYEDHFVKPFLSAPLTPEQVAVEDAKQQEETVQAIAKDARVVIVDIKAAIKQALDRHTAGDVDWKAPLDGASTALRGVDDVVKQIGIGRTAVSGFVATYPANALILASSDNIDLAWNDLKTGHSAALLELSDALKLPSIVVTGPLLPSNSLEAKPEDQAILDMQKEVERAKKIALDAEDLERHAAAQLEIVKKAVADQQDPSAGIDAIRDDVNAVNELMVEIMAISSNARFWGARYPANQMIKDGLRSIENAANVTLDALNKCRAHLKATEGMTGVVNNGGIDLDDLKRQMLGLLRKVNDESTGCKKVYGWVKEINDMNFKRMEKYNDPDYVAKEGEAVFLMDHPGRIESHIGKARLYLQDGEKFSLLADGIVQSASGEPQLVDIDTEIKKLVQGMSDMITEMENWLQTVADNARIVGADQNAHQKTTASDWKKLYGLMKNAFEAGKAMYKQAKDELGVFDAELGAIRVDTAVESLRRLIESANTLKAVHDEMKNIQVRISDFMNKLTAKKKHEYFHPYMLTLKHEQEILGHLREVDAWVVDAQERLKAAIERKDADDKAQSAADQKAKEDEALKKEEDARLAQQEADRLKANEEAARKAQEAADQKAKERENIRIAEQARLAQQEADRLKAEAARRREEAAKAEAKRLLDEHEESIRLAAAKRSEEEANKKKGLDDIQRMAKEARDVADAANAQLAGFGQVKTGGKSLMDQSKKELEQAALKSKASSDPKLKAAIVRLVDVAIPLTFDYMIETNAELPDDATGRYVAYEQGFQALMSCIGPLADGDDDLKDELEEIASKLIQLHQHKMLGLDEPDESELEPLKEMKALVAGALTPLLVPLVNTNGLPFLGLLSMLDRETPPDVSRLKWDPAMQYSGEEVLRLFAAPLVRLTRAMSLFKTKAMMKDGRISGFEKDDMTDEQLRIIHQGLLRDVVKPFGVDEPGQLNSLIDAVVPPPAPVGDVTMSTGEEEELAPKPKKTKKPKVVTNDEEVDVNAITSGAKPMPGPEVLETIPQSERDRIARAKRAQSTVGLSSSPMIIAWREKITVEPNTLELFTCEQISLSRSKGKRYTKEYFEPYKAWRDKKIADETADLTKAVEIVMGQMGFARIQTGRLVSNVDDILAEWVKIQNKKLPDLVDLLASPTPPAEWRLHAFRVRMDFLKFGGRYVIDVLLDGLPWLLPSSLMKAKAATVAKNLNDLKGKLTNEIKRRGVDASEVKKKTSEMLEQLQEACEEETDQWAELTNLRKFVHANYGVELSRVAVKGVDALGAEIQKLMVISNGPMDPKRAYVWGRIKNTKILYKHLVAVKKSLVSGFGTDFETTRFELFETDELEKHADLFDEQITILESDPEDKKIIDEFVKKQGQAGSTGGQQEQQGQIGQAEPMGQSEDSGDEEVETAAGETSASGKEKRVKRWFGL
jgi:hypothetical protein